MVMMLVCVRVKKKINSPIVVIVVFVTKIVSLVMMLQSVLVALKKL